MWPLMELCPGGKLRSIRDCGMWKCYPKYCVSGFGSILVRSKEIPLRIIGEVQLILDGYEAVKKRMHLVYEVNRGSFDRKLRRG